MIGPTHVIGGNFAYLVTAWWVGHPPQLGEAVVAMAATLLPDLDSAKSYVGRHVPRLTLAVEQRVDHRWRMEAMGRGELAFAVGLTLLTGPVAYAGERGVGVLGTIRDAIGDIAHARKYYDDHRGEAAWWLIVEGYDNRLRAAIAGRYRVIGSYRGDGLLIHTPNGTRSVCRSGACDWHARHAVLERGRPEQTTVRWLRAEHITPAALLEAIDPLHALGELYLIGEISGRQLHGDPPTLLHTGTIGTLDRMTLDHATPMQIRHQPGPFTSVNVLIQVRHPPGLDVPYPLRPEAIERPPIHPLLRQYLP